VFIRVFQVLGRHLGAMQIGVFRFLVQGVICSCVMRYKGISWKPATTKIGWLLFLRGFLGSAAMLGYFYALTRMVLSDATVIVFTNPIFTSIFGAVVRVWLLHCTVLHRVSPLCSGADCL
jgi:drug/metabolite transporter (DMT)-like permease